jgi:hypothetical protein
MSTPNVVAARRCRIARLFIPHLGRAYEWL